MKDTFKMLISCFLCIAIYACTLVPNVDKESLPTTARVGVISLMYDYMDYLSYSGIPFSSYKNSSHYVKKWNLNNFAVSAISKHLEDRFEIVNVSYSPTILKRGFDNTNFYTGLPIYYIRTVEESYNKIVNTYNLDAIIILLQNYTKPRKFSEAYSYGFIYKNLLKPKIKSFAAISLRVYDAKTLDVIALAENVNTYINVEGIRPYPSFYDYSKNEKNKLKYWAERAINDAILSAIDDMKLTDGYKKFILF